MKNSLTILTKKILEIKLQEQMTEIYWGIVYTVKEAIFKKF